MKQLIKLDQENIWHEILLKWASYNYTHSDSLAFCEEVLKQNMV